MCKSKRLRKLSNLHTFLRLLTHTLRRAELQSSDAPALACLHRASRSVLSKATKDLGDLWVAREKHCRLDSVNLWQVTLWHKQHELAMRLKWEQTWLGLVQTCQKIQRKTQQIKGLIVNEKAARAKVKRAERAEFTANCDTTGKVLNDLVGKIFTLEELERKEQLDKVDKVMRDAKARMENFKEQLEKVDKVMRDASARMGKLKTCYEIDQFFVAFLQF